MNDDDWPEPCFYERMSAGLEESPEVGLAWPRVVVSQGENGTAFRLPDGLGHDQVLAGVPARVTAMRFSPDIVEELQLWADYSVLDEAGMKQMRDLLRMNVSADTLPLMHQLFVDSALGVGGSSGPKRGA